MTTENSPASRAAATGCKRWAGRLAASLVAIAAIPTLIGALGIPWLSGSTAWLFWANTFDVLNSFIPFWALLIALGLGLALVAGNRSRLFLAISTLLLLLALAPIALEVFRPLPWASPGSQRSLRIIQFNALSSNRHLDEALDLALRSDADLILVQETTHFQLLAPSLRALYPYHTPCPQRGCEAVIYSRTAPIAAVYSTMQGNWYGDRDTEGNGSIGVASMSLPGPDGVPFTAVATHFKWPWPPITVQHQRDNVLEGLGRIDLSRTIFTGDFNLTPWTYEMRGLDEDLRPMRRVTRALFSFPAFISPNSEIPVPFPLLPIDHVYVGPDWRLVDVRQGPASGSDHYPVIVDLALSGDSGRP